MRAIFISTLLAPILALQPAVANSADPAAVIHVFDTRSQPVSGTEPFRNWRKADGALTADLAPDLTRSDISANSRTMFGLLPEPSTWFSMIAGFTLVGAVVRKARRDNNI